MLETSRVEIELNLAGGWGWGPQAVVGYSDGNFVQLVFPGLLTKLGQSRAFEDFFFPRVLA